MSVIKVNDLMKSYGRSRALNGLDLAVEKGEVFGFIGPNGAGKTTTIRILLGLLTKDGGGVELLDGDPWRDSVELHKRLAYVPGDVSLWPNLSGGEVIDLLSRLRGSFNTKRRDMLMERFNLDPTKKCHSYSKGNRQKVALVTAFASDVELYVLDEPTSGLDPLMEVVFQECVAELKGEGRTIFLSSHILAEVEALCDRVGIIKGGRIVESGTLAELRHLTRVSLSVETFRPLEGLKELPGVNNPVIDGNHAKFNVDSGELDSVLKHLTLFGVRSLTSTPPTLEELFMRHYGDDPADGGGKR